MRVHSRRLLAARCLVDLEDFKAASDHARRALVLRSAERIRARALASLVLARAALGQRDLEQACALVSQVSTATETLGSGVVADQFRDAVDALAAFHDTEAVSKALPQLQSASDRRAGMRRAFHPGSGVQT